MYIFFIISTLILATGIFFLFLGIKKQKTDLSKLEKEKRSFLEKQTKDLEEQIKSLEQDCEKIKNEKIQITIEKEATARERKVEKERLEEILNQKHKILETEKESIEKEISLTKQLKMQQLEQFYKQEKIILEENFQQQKNTLQEQIIICKNDLEQFKRVQESINEAIKRRKEILENEFFYSIDISKQDQEDIFTLQTMNLRLHNRDVIPKLIWELFVRRPTQEMIKRIIGSEKISGIYKITYKETGEAYIGKSTDLATRWTNHVKTAIGLEGAARATLHNRMAKDGIWNYTFEILEKVDKQFLSSRESYYIELYGTKNQLNMKSGEKNGTQ